MGRNKEERISGVDEEPSRKDPFKDVVETEPGMEREFKGPHISGRIVCEAGSLKRVASEQYRFYFVA